ncbi:Retinal guanylyl cyclase 1 [Sparganum proliferum]
MTSLPERLAYFVITALLPLYSLEIPSFDQHSEQGSSFADSDNDIILNLYLIGSNNSCLQDSAAYDLLTSVRTATRFTLSQYDSPLGLSNLSIKYQVIDGCSNGERTRGMQLISALASMRNLAEKGRSWSVFLGPPLGGDCNIASDWVANEVITSDTQKSLYLVEYSCRLEFLGRRFAQVDRPLVEFKDINLAAVSMTAQTSVLADALETFLRFQGWQNVLIVFEVSEARMQNHVVAKSLQMYLTYPQEGLDPICIIDIVSFQCDSEPLGLDELNARTVDVILLLARPAKALEVFKTPNIQKIVNSGKVAVIQLDPSSSNTYDTLRAWRLAMEVQTEIGVAGLCLFLMNANPAGSGFDISSPLLNSPVEVSVASAASLAVRMAQVLLEYGNGSIPENTDFFQPLAEPLIRVPCLPGITFSIGRKGESFVDYYDFYLFGIRYDFLFNTSRNVTTARWDEIYQLEDLILEGTNTVQEVIRKQWPGNGSGPSVNYCMLVACENGKFS